MNCDEIDYRIAASAIGIVVYCVGIPLVATMLLAMYHLRKFKSSLSFYLVRSIFSGHNATATGMAYRIWTLLRTFVFTTISLAPLSHTSQGLGILMLVVASMLFESLADPRTTSIMSIMGCMEEVVVCVVVCVGLFRTGTTHRLECAMCSAHFCD